MHEPCQLEDTVLTWTSIRKLIILLEFGSHVLAITEEQYTAAPIKNTG